MFAMAKTIFACVGVIAFLVFWKANAPESFDMFWSTIGSLIG
jgi:hypothetical protein